MMYLISKIEAALELDLKIEAERKAFRFYLIVNLILSFFLMIQMVIRIGTVGFGISFFAPFFSLLFLIGHFGLMYLGVFFRTAQYVFYGLTALLGVLVAILAGGLSGVDGHAPILFILWSTLFFKPKPALIASMIAIGFGVAITFLSPFIQYELFQSTSEQLALESLITGLMRVVLIGLVSLSFHRWVKTSKWKILSLGLFTVAWVIMGFVMESELNFWLPFVYPLILFSGSILNWLYQIGYLAFIFAVIILRASQIIDWTPFISLTKASYFTHGYGLMSALFLILIFQIQAYRKKL